MSDPSTPPGPSDRASLRTGPSTPLRSPDGAPLTPGPRVRVILADDHTLVRAGIRRILESQPEFEVVAEAADGVAALAAIERYGADVLVLDLNMNGLEGIDVLRRGKTAHPELKVVILTMHAGREYVSRGDRRGRGRLPAEGFGGPGPGGCNPRGDRRRHVLQPGDPAADGRDGP